MEGGQEKTTKASAGQVKDQGSSRERESVGGWEGRVSLNGRRELLLEAFRHGSHERAPVERWHVL